MARACEVESAPAALIGVVARKSRPFVLVAVFFPMFFTLAACTAGPSAESLSIAGVDHFAIGNPASEGARLAVWAAGREDARRLILVHGTPGSAAIWRRYLADPMPGLRTIAFDRPGFGQTKPSASVVSFEAQAAALALLLEPARDGTWPILVGHSLGGPIIARAAADQADRVGGIVILAGSLDPSLEKPRWFNHAADSILARLLLSSAWIHSNDEILSAPIHTRALAEVLDRVRCPVVVIHGTRDSLVPYANVDFMRRAFSNAASLEIVTLAGADHFIPWTHERVVRTAVAELDRISARPQAGISERHGVSLR